MPAVATQLGLGGGGYLGDAGGAYSPTILKCNFCTAPKAKNGQPTVKCRDYLIFGAMKCSKTTFSRSFTPDPIGRAYSTPPDP